MTIVKNILLGIALSMLLLAVGCNASNLQDVDNDINAHNEGGGGDV